MAEVIVIGGANLDVKGKSASDFIPRTSNPGHVVTGIGGVARNIAANLARLEIRSALIGVTGSDAGGCLILEATREAGVDTAMVKRVDGASGTYLAILDSRGELVAAVSDMACLDHLTPADLAAHAARLHAAEFLVADCNLTLDCLDWLVAFAAKNRIRLLIEPVSVSKAQKLKRLKGGAFAVTPNADQFASLTGGSPDDSAALAALHAMGYANIVVHRGGAGALVSDGRGLPVAVAAMAGKVADVTGAGDAAVAGLICGLLAGYDLARSARLGQAAAAVRIAPPQSMSAGFSRDSVFALAGIP